MLRIGLIGCDSSHSVAFTQRFNQVGVDERLWVEGARAVAAVPGTSEIGPERIAGHVEKLRELGIAILARPEELIGQVDAAMITATDGNVHRALAEPLL